jgi:hypothetical protein
MENDVVNRQIRNVAIVGTGLIAPFKMLLDPHVPRIEVRLVNRGAVLVQLEMEKQRFPLV